MLAGSIRRCGRGPSAAAPRAANVIACGKLKCLYISKDAFEEVLGPLRAIIEADMLQREAVAQGRQPPTPARRALQPRRSGTGDIWARSAAAGGGGGEQAGGRQGSSSGKLAP